MLTSLHQKKLSFFNRLSAITILLCFLGTTIVPPSFAQEIFLPAPGTMVGLSETFNPPLLKGIKVYQDNPFLFDFILDKGTGTPADKADVSKLVKYFLASLTTPEKEMWVNLSPYEKDRIVPESFGQTQMGRDLLAQDYMLKQITASLMYPEDTLGKKFWGRVYAQAKQKFGTTDIPVDTFNKVWIVPERAVVYENSQSASAYVLESSLKVMLEEDYLALEKNISPPLVGGARGGVDVNHAPRPNPPHGGGGNISSLGSQIIREIILPELEKEVNFGKNFAQLRQIYNSLILAEWYKRKIKDSILSQVYVDKNKIAGVNIDDPNEKQKIYERYLEAFKKGAYNYIKEEIDPSTQDVIPKKYFSGGFSATNFAASSSLEIRTDAKDLSASAPIKQGEGQVVRVELESASGESRQIFGASSALFASYTGDLNYWGERNRLSRIIQNYSHPARKNRDVNGNVMQLDLVENLIAALVRHEQSSFKKIDSDEVVIEMAKVFNAIAYDIPLESRLGSRNYSREFNSVVDDIFNAQDIETVKEILKKITPTPKVTQNPIRSDFQDFIKAQFNSLFADEKMPVLPNAIGQNYGDLVEVLDLGSEQVQRILSEKHINIVEPDANVLTRYSDEELLETSGKWTRTDSHYRIAVTAEGNLVFIKQRDSSGFHIISDFYVDYFDMGTLMEKIGRDNFLQIMTKVQVAYSQIMGIHPDTQLSNFLVKVTRDGDSFEMDYKPIDFEKNPRSSSPLDEQNAQAKVASAPVENPFPNLGNLADVSSDDIFRQLDSKSVMRQLLAGPQAPVRQPENIVIFKREGALYSSMPQWKNPVTKEMEDVADRTPWVEFTNPNDVKEFKEAMKELLEQKRVFSVVLKQQNNVRGNGVFFLERKLGDPRVFIKAAGGGDDIYMDNVLDNFSVRDKTIDRKSRIVTITLDPNKEDILQELVRIWEHISTYQRSSYDPGFMEAYVPTIKVKGQKAYETRHVVIYDSKTGDISLDEYRTAWIARIGSSSEYSNYLGRDSGVQTSMIIKYREGIYNPLEAHVEGSLSHFEKKVDEILVRETDYLIKRMQAAGIQLEGRFGIVFDFMWFKNDRTNELEPILTEATLGNEKQAKLKIIAKDTAISTTKGGIDFNADKMNLETRSSGGEIKFQINPEQLREFQNAPGFTPIIINIQPLINLPLFLGLKDSQPMTVAAAKE